MNFKKENIYLAGSIDALENWSPDKALALSYTEKFWTSKHTDVVSSVVLNIFALSHRYTTRKHQLPVQIHSQV